MGGTGDLALGSRIAVRGNHRGTILFIGSVPGHSGDWAGVEWDDATRGKHDGSVDGRRLFACRKSGTSATFVRLSKLKEALIEPISILDGIKLRYCAASIPVAERDRHIQVAGLDKLVDEASDLSTLEHASLSGMNVVAKDTAYDLAQAVPKLRTLDLSQTLGGSWREVAVSLQMLPCLETLDLGGTVILDSEKTPSSGSAGTKPVLRALKTLNLSGSGLNLASALRIAVSTLPGLETLALHDCVHEAAPDSSKKISSEGCMLQSLDLSGKEIRCWNDVLAVGTALPNLRSLNLCGTQLQGAIGESEVVAEAFPRLDTLLLGETGLATWTDVQALDRLPALCNLRIAGSPIWSSTGNDATSRAITIARLGRLNVLNASLVSEAERKDAVLWYLSHVRAELSERGASRDRAEILQLHPRFEELLRKYEGSGSNPSSSMTRASLVEGSNARKQFVELVLDCNGKTLPKKLPGSITLQRLKMLLERLLGVPASEQQLLLENAGAMEDISSYDARELNAFSIAPGTRLYIQQLDVQSQQVMREGDVLAQKASEVEKINAQEAQFQRLYAEQRRLMQ